jgi:hypothetical protein
MENILRETEMIRAMWVPDNNKELDTPLKYAVRKLFVVLTLPLTLSLSHKGRGDDNATV